MSYDWLRVSKRRPCPICRKPDWCLYHRDGTAAICPRVSDGHSRDLGEAGFLHRIGNGNGRIRLPHVEPLPIRNFQPMPDVLPDFEKINAGYRRNLYGDMLQKYAAELGVSAESLDRLDVGNTGKGGWSFPMRDEEATMIGIRIRGDRGRKWAYPGSRNGLFVPRGLTGKGPLLTAEGPTDTAAMLTVGFDCIGRPSCTGGVDMAVLFCGSREAVVVADCDGPGQRGAIKLADALFWKSKVRVIVPPQSQDAREWLCDGATREVVWAVINNTALHAKPKV